MGIYAFRVEVAVPPLPDLTGFDVEATDGHIGKSDELTMAEGATCLVVDTGSWIFGKKRMIPAGVVGAVDVDDKQAVVDMTKDEIKDAPDYDEDRHRTDEPADHDEVGKYYDRWGGTPPMEGTDQARPVAWLGPVTCSRRRRGSAAGRPSCRWARPVGSRSAGG
jgi:hypothetical protein